MDNRNNMLQLCRLCLVKDDVNIPIFEEHGDIRQIFLKISSCLPIKVSREDKLPKKICDGCSFKLDTLYEFWNTSANAEKQLLTWLGEAGMNSQTVDGTISAVAQQIKPTDAFVKQETIDPPDIHTEDNDDDKDYMFQQKFEESASAGPSATVTSNEEEEPPPPKRARRTAAVKAAIAMDHDSDDDDDSGEPMTKVEDESEDSEGEDQEPSFADAPSTSADDQPGPSGVGKDGVEAPLNEDIDPQQSVFIVIPEATNSNITTDEASTSKPLRERLVNPRSKKANMQSVQNSKEKIVQGYSETLTIMIDDSDIPEEYVQKENSGSKSTSEIFLRSVSDAPQYTQYIADILSNITSTSQSGKERSNGKIEYIKNEKVRFKCKICQSNFTNGEIFNEHLRSHRSEYQMEECSLCNKKFHRKDLLKHEFTLHKPKIPGRKKCSECDKEYKSTHSLHKHYAYHHKEFGFVDRTKILICEICGRRCRGNHPFEIHYRTHTGEKPFLCSVCPKSFGFAEALKHHMRIHTGEKPLICKYCGNKYAHTHAYRYHLKTHTGNKPYSCENCGKRFISKYNMRAHFKSCSISHSK